MKQNGRNFHCEACRQFVVSFSVSEASLYLPGRIVAREQNGRPSEEGKAQV
jgi:hypothetical protein